MAYSGGRENQFGGGCDWTHQHDCGFRLRVGIYFIIMFVLLQIERNLLMTPLVVVDAVFGPNAVENCASHPFLYSIRSCCYSFYYYPSDPNRIGNARRPEAKKLLQVSRFNLRRLV